MKIKNKLLLGASVLALSMGTLSSLSFAQCTSPGNQTRAVNCLDHAGNAVAASYCLNATYASVVGPQPDATQPCTISVSCGQRDRDRGGGGQSGGGYVDTDGDGRGDTRADEAPPGDWNSSDTMGGRNSGSTSINDSGWVSGSHDDGETGRSDNDSVDRSNDTVLCTYFHRLGELSDDDYYNGFIYSLNHSHKATWRGYHFWAVPYVEHLYKNPNSILAKIIKPVVIHRAKEISYQLGLESKPDYLGKLFRLIIEPISFTLGLFVEQRDYSALYTKKELIALSRQNNIYKKRQQLKAQGFLPGTPLASFAV